MGNQAISTPNIDRIASDGVLFRKAYVSVPSSTPARASLLTGCSPWQHGLLGYGKVAEKYPYEMPQMLKNAGYFTFGIGKMHWTPQRNLHGFHGTLLDESGRVESADFVSDYRQWFAMEAPGENPDQTGIGWNEHRGGVYALDQNLHPSEWTGNEAVRFISNYKQKEALFLKISFARPHSPYDPPQSYLDKYKNIAMPAPVVGDWCANFANRPMKADAAFGDFGAEHARESRQYYYAAITFIDDQVGRIVESLKQNNMYHNSLIIFISDHGDMLGDHHHWRKTYAYEGSAHIPFIVKPPKDFGHQEGSSLSQTVELRDVLPTMLDAAAIEKPQPMDGLSVLSIIANSKADWRPFIDLEHATCYEHENYWCALTDGKEKYIWFFHTAQEQYFDLVSDPYETKNLIKDKKQQKQIAKWRKNMSNHLSVRGMPYFKDGELQQFDATVLYGPNYPKNK
ncbi:choline-sulfatase [Bacteroidales bacterium]|nr:choline-sulfatase [Bacteroidales bacterium]